MPDTLLQAGDAAPDFTLLSTEGNAIHLYELLESSKVVLFFYVLAFTPLCTAQVCSFRERAEEFRAENVVPLGIGSEPAAVARRFAKRLALPYPLLLDEGGRVRRLYRVPRTFGLVPGRVTYAISQHRTILQSYNAASQGAEHAATSLAWLRKGISQK